MKSYKVIIIGIVIFIVGAFLGVSTTGQALASQIKEIVVVNFPVLQKVLVENTEPIDVNVVNQTQQPSQQEVLLVNEEPIDINIVNQQEPAEPLTPKVITFFDNECGLGSGSLSPVFNVEGYSTIIVHTYSGFYPSVRCSVDGIHWVNENLDDFKVSEPIVLSIKAPEYRIQLGHVPSGCATIKGYLLP